MGNFCTSSPRILTQTVEVGLELDGKRAIVHRLRELAPGDLALRDEDDATKTRAGRISCHRRGRISRRRACDPLEATLGGDGKRSGHARVFEGAGGVHALVLGEQPVDAGGFGAAGKIVERGVALAESDDFFQVIDDGQQVAEAPDTGLVHC